MTSLYEQAHAEFLAHADDPVWRLAMEIYLGETFQEMATYHQGQIQAIADKAMLTHLNSMRAGITKRYLADRIAEIQKSSIKKDARWSKEGYWVRSHGKFARYIGPGQLPDNHLGPVPMSHSGIGGGVQGSQKHANPQQFLRAQMLSNPPGDTAEYQDRIRGMRESNAVTLPFQPSAQHQDTVWHKTAQMVDDLYAKTNDPRDKQRVQYLIQSPDGTKRLEIPEAGNLPDVNYEAGERVHMMTPIGPDNPAHVGGQAINIGLIAGMTPEKAAQVGGVTQGIHDTMSQTTWGQKMQSVASTVAALSGNHPVATQAHAFAQMVNLIGPQASRAFGGKWRQLTYRYTGQEYDPSDYTGAAKSGKGENEPTAAYEVRLMQDLANSGAIPTQTQYRTSMKNGSTPPSHGYMLDKNGKVVSQAVGFSDDWYTPFNLKKLPNLKGGSYVRTRSYGGLTPEDIRLAMRTGAHRVTVISNNGVFSMEMNPKALHWGHRFGFAGGAIVRRYAKSLDAIKHGKIDNADEAGSALKLNARGYEAAMQDLKLKYPYWIKHPGDTPLKAFHRDLGAHEGGIGIDWAGHDRQRHHDDTDSYVSPLDSRAKGAMHGWYEHGASSLNLWDAPDTGKHAYNTIDRFKVHHDTLLNVHRLKARVDATRTSSGSSSTTRSGGGGTNGGGTGTTRRVGETGADPVQRVAPKSSSQGADNSERVNAGEVDKMLREVGRFSKQAQDEHKFDLVDALDNEHAAKLVELVRDNKNFTSHPDYKGLRARLVESQDARDNFASALGDALLDSGVPGYEETLAQVTSIDPNNRDDEEDEGSASDEFVGERYNGHGTIPAIAVERSQAVQNWIKKLPNSNPELAKALDIWVKERIRMASDEGYKPWRGENKDVYKEVNVEIARILNEEAEHKAKQKADPVTDTGERAQVKGDTVSFNPQSWLSSGKEPADIAADKYDEMTGSRPVEGEEDPRAEVVMDVIKKLSNEAERRKGLGDKQRAKFFADASQHLSRFLADDLYGEVDDDDLESLIDGADDMDAQFRRDLDDPDK